MKTRAFHLGDYRRAHMGPGNDVPHDYFFVNGEPLLILQDPRFSIRCPLAKAGRTPTWAISGVVTFFLVLISLHGTSTPYYLALVYQLPRPEID